MCSAHILARLCRLCSLEIENGFDIFIESEVKASLVILINKYLPIKVNEDNVLPKQICESCHIGVAATVDLIDRMVEGQHRLRKLYKTCLEEKSFSSSKDQSSNQYTENVSSIQQNQFNTCTLGHNIQKNITTENVCHNSCPTNSSNSEKQVGSSISVKQKDSTTKKDEVTPHTLIDIQGNTSDIEMDDLAKGTGVKKVYESHPLGLIVEGKEVKRKRGRPKKDQSRGAPKPQLSVAIEEEGRPKRVTQLPSRYKDTVAGKEFDNLLQDPENTKDSDQLKTEEFFPFAECGFFAQEKTQTLEGNTVVITPNHMDEAQPKLPAAVNIELDFEDANLTLLQMDTNGVMRVEHTPKASVSSIPEEDLTKMSLLMTTSKRNNASGDAKTFHHSPRRKRVRGKKFKYFCQFCNKGFLHKGRYLLHLKLHKNVLFRCDVCNCEFPDIEDMKLHLQVTNHKGIGLLERENNENRSIKCLLCNGKTFSTMERYNAHVASGHEGQKPFICVICTKRFAYRHTLKTHYQIHQPVKDKRCYPCKLCDKEFSHQSSLYYHLDTSHNSERKFVCQICGYSFKHKQLLQRHFAVHSEERPYACKTCGNRFKTSGNLYNHLNIHTKNKVFPCEVCSKKFIHPTSLTLHMRSHTGEKPYSCFYCDKRFSQNGNLREHIRIHTGVKPYCCTICEKKFTTSSQLNLHEKRHKGKYKGNCSICGKGFLSEDALLAHQHKHKMGASYLCKFCDQSFIDKTHLTKHLKIHYLSESKGNDKTFKCIDCEKHLSDAEALSKHMEEHQAEKTWFIAQPTNLNSAQEIIYVLPKKDEPSLSFISLAPDEIFGSDNDVQGKEQLRATSSIVNSIPETFILPQSNPVNSGSDAKVSYTMDISDSSFEIPESLAFIPVGEESSIYSKRVFES